MDRRRNDRGRRDRARLAECRRAPARCQPGVFANDQGDYCAAAVRNAGQWHCRALQPEEDRSDGHQGDRVFRGRHHDCADDRTRCYQSEQGRGGREVGCSGCRRNTRGNEADRRRHNLARLPRKHRQIGRRQPGAANCRVQHRVWHCARDGARGQAQTDAGV